MVLAEGATSTTVSVYVMQKLVAYIDGTHFQITLDSDLEVSYKSKVF